MILSGAGALWLVWSTVARAMPQGAPIADPATARVTAAAVVSTEVAHQRPSNCAGQTCDVQLSRVGAGAMAELALLPGVGLQAEMARVTIGDDSLDYAEQGVETGAAIELARRFAGDWGAALSARGRLTSLPDQASTREVTVSAAGTWGRPDAGLVAWAGLQVPVLVDVELPPAEGQTEWNELIAARPLSATFGLALMSSPMGVPWRRTPRATVGLEGWAGQANGASAWLGLAL